MTKEYTEEENKIWRASQPQKMIVAKVIIKSDKGNILLAKPNYKKTWQFPGGGVENKESPEDAAIRETQEELNLTLSKDNLQIMGTIYKEDEEMLFVIYQYMETFSEDVELKVQDDEITDFQFANPNDVPELLSPYYANFWAKNYIERL